MFVLFSSRTIPIQKFNDDSIEITKDDVILFDIYPDGADLLGQTKFFKIPNIEKCPYVIDSIIYPWIEKEEMSKETYGRVYLRTYIADKELLLLIKIPKRNYEEFVEKHRLIRVRTKMDTIIAGIIINKKSEFAKIAKQVQIDKYDILQK